ncbi:MAG: aldo/keto reductase [Bacteroidota bacterium]
MKFVKFDNGDLMPALGLGTWKSAKGEVYKVVRESIEVGYRHFDCALLYGNEEEIGQAFYDAFKAGDISREELWITSKLWNNAHEPQNVLPNIHKSLKNLQVDYLDLYLIHWPVALRSDVTFPSKGSELVSLKDIPLSKTWQSMIELQNAGLSRHIGVSNFSKKKMQNLIDETGVRPEVDQVEMHPLLQQPDLLEFCNEKGIHMTAYAPLGSADRPENRKVVDEPGLFSNKIITQVAENKGISIGQLLLAWAVNRGTSVIPKTVRKERLIENLAAADLSLSDNEMAEMAKVNLNYRYIKGNFWCLEGSDYTLQNLWDE